MSRTRFTCVPACSSSDEGTVSTGSPVSAAISNSCLRRGPRSEGSAITRCVAAPRTALSCIAASGPSTGTPAMRAPCLAGSSSSRPSTVQPWSWMPDNSSLAVSPAPSTSARRISVSLPVIWRRACS